MNISEVTNDLLVPNNNQKYIKSHPTMNSNQVNDQPKYTHEELIQKEIRQQSGSICICNHSDIWCSYCYGEFDLFD